MRTIIAKPGMTLPLGHEEENLAREILFDIDGWRKLYGNGTVQLIASRSGEQDIYPVTITMRDNFAVWAVSRSDTALKGRGCCELQYYAGDTLVKSETWTTYVADAMGEPTGDPPEPYQSWVEQVLTAGSEAAESARKAEEALAKNPKISPAGTWLVWDSAAGEYRDTGVSAVGSGVQLDETLKISGKAADAKAAGDAIDDLARSAAAALGEETARAQAVEDSLDAGISAEESRATAAEADLSRQLVTEKARAEQAEADLKQHINDLIDAKLTPIDALADDITEVVGA